MNHLYLAVLIFFVIAAATLSIAQTNQGSISGVATDSTGAGGDESAGDSP
jgi:hypothetical protein